MAIILSSDRQNEELFHLSYTGKVYCIPVQFNTKYQVGYHKTRYALEAFWGGKAYRVSQWDEEADSGTKMSFEEWILRRTVIFYLLSFIFYLDILCGIKSMFQISDQIINILNSHTQSNQSIINSDGFPNFFGNGCMCHDRR